MRSTQPKIVWGAAFANTALFGYPLDNPVSYPEPRAGHEEIQLESGVEDAFSYGDDQCLGGDLRWIPTADISGPPDPPATGWDGATGIAAMLSWLRAKNVGRWYPDKASGSYVPFYLVEPMNGVPKLETDGLRTLSIKLRSSDGSIFTGY